MTTENQKTDAAKRKAGSDKSGATKPEATMGESGSAKTEQTDEAAKAETAKAEAVTGEIVTEEPATAGAAGSGATTGGPFTAELESLRSELDERLRDLQRVTAEYANYRKRVERDRTAMAEQAVGSVIVALLPIMDDLDRAREHDDLVGPAAAMADQLNAALGKFGVTGFGEVGDSFDPTRHEAVAHQTSADVTEPTCVAVMRRGYLLGERLLRAAMVAVADPE